MIEIRPVETAADYESWRQVRLAALPYERAPSVAELQQSKTAARLLLIAEEDGVVVAHGGSDRSNEPDRAAVVARVRPEARRRGIGTALLRELTRHAADLGFTIAGCSIDDEGSLEFAKRFGFREYLRQVEQVRRIADEPWPPEPTGYDVIQVAERPELWAAAYEQVAVPTLPELDTTATLDVTAEEWATEWINDPAAMFLAIKGTEVKGTEVKGDEVTGHEVTGDEVIGVAGLLLDTDHPERAEVAYTAVRPEWRGKGVASTLKRSSMAWAAEHGITEIYTWTQEGNANMRRLNEHLGFSYRTVSVNVRAELPLQFPEEVGA
ncbi:GNAT family N-acetyltransferase [Kribbella sp. NPDC048915]|uniref:GNAT family N-acetyltransferase n=1 Tax=Kribbella sp. NPDC048915 TaxID=3155148 RepID=UPI0033CFEE68